MSISVSRAKLCFERYIERFLKYKNNKIEFIRLEFELEFKFVCKLCDQYVNKKMVIQYNTVTFEIIKDY